MANLKISICTRSVFFCFICDEVESLRKSPFWTIRVDAEIFFVVQTYFCLQALDSQIMKLTYILGMNFH